MKKIALATVIVFLIASCGVRDQKKKPESEVLAQTQIEPEECNPKKYQLCDSLRNYFTIENEEVRIKLHIPVTSDSLQLVAIKNMPNKNINAIMVHLKGGVNCTPVEPIIDFIEIDTVIHFSNSDLTRLQGDNKLLIYIYNNQDELQSTKIDGIGSYEDALRKIREESLCNDRVETSAALRDTLIIFQPKEQDGDVIGGNQKK
ncbi:hypothetical protein [Allomuricauda sp. M10]|uniref:hypothetical protein n=1 Tax=Allomuricauda sp. M10 TaxID=2683292 RepID=UPI001D18AA07|nr:hypothetical protein [Muricauda sp. M10]